MSRDMPLSQALVILLAVICAGLLAICMALVASKRPF